MTDDEICEMVNQAFKGTPRPEHFTNYTHCDECEEHDNLLRSRNLETLEVGDIDNEMWDPICFLTPEGWRYYFPALVRISLEDLENGYVGHFLHHLMRSENDPSFALFNKHQNRAAFWFLQHVQERHKGLCDEDELAAALKIWKAKVVY